MTMSRDLFLAILAMDSYNRGYNQSVGGLPEEGSLGSATIVSRSEIFGSEADAVFQNWQDAGFYAIAYNWNGETIISYRGTDDTSDAFAFGIGAGQPALPGRAQPQMLAFDSATALHSCAAFDSVS